MRILVTGNAGFIGTHVWTYFLDRGYEVYGIDDLSRKVSKRVMHPNAIVDDVVNISKIEALDIPFDWVIHLAAQVSVVVGEDDPVLDFKTNCQGTFEVVQWAKARGAGVIYASTNKVFGELADVKSPILDSQPISPQTNYGVSKAAGSHYVRDYDRGWVLHQSCIYGSSQKGEEDQGWIGWVYNSIKSGRPIRCFGDGHQVRDLLHVKDLINLYNQIIEGGIVPGSYVTGGGSSNAVSFEEVVKMLGGEISEYLAWRPNDQRYFVSANEQLLVQGWRPTITVREGLGTLT
jgi:CDP-paratose 2-epimerase